MLSPGQRKRWQIGTALFAEPDVLLLDEPTNHLDLRGRNILLQALHRFRGVGLVVSHDRELLDDLTTHTVRLVDGDAEQWEGGYSVARELWLEAEARRRSDHDRARAQERKLQRQLDQARRNRASAEAGSARERRVASHRDHVAHSFSRKFVALRAEQALARTEASRKSRLDRAVAATAAIRVRRTHAGAITFEAGGRGGRWLAELKAPVLHAGDHPLLHEADVAVAADDRIRIAGANGAGKTTLLTHLLLAARTSGRRSRTCPRSWTSMTRGA